MCNDSNWSQSNTSSEHARLYTIRQTSQTSLLDSGCRSLCSCHTLRYSRRHSHFSVPTNLRSDNLEPSPSLSTLGESRCSILLSFMLDVRCHGNEYIRELGLILQRSESLVSNIYQCQKRSIRMLHNLNCCDAMEYPVFCCLLLRFPWGVCHVLGANRWYHDV